MFSDRNYGNRYGVDTNYWAVPSLILVCVVIFLFQNMMLRHVGYRIYDPVTSKLALTAYGIRSLQLWRLVTYMFVHGGFFHLFINMWGLYLFGSMLERRIGSVNFLKLYFISGIVGAFLWLGFNWSNPIPCVGASGSLFGVMVAAAMMYPNAMIMLLIPPIPLKLKTFVVIYAIIESFSTVTGVDGQVAHLVHLGGLIAGYFYMRSAYPRDTYDVLKFLKLHLRKNTGATHSKTASKKWKFVDSSANRLDAILDKISTSGINALTEKELEILKEARDKMRDKS